MLWLQPCPIICMFLLCSQPLFYTLGQSIKHVLVVRSLKDHTVIIFCPSNVVLTYYDSKSTIPVRPTVSGQSKQSVNRWCLFKDTETNGIGTFKQTFWWFQFCTALNTICRSLSWIWSPHQCPLPLWLALLRQPQSTEWIQSINIVGWNHERNIIRKMEQCIRVAYDNIVEVSGAAILHSKSSFSAAI